MEIIYCIILILLFILMVLSLEYLQVKGIANGEITRKLGHLILGIILIIMPILFEQIYYACIVCVIISLIIFICSKNNRLSCADNVERITYGTFLFPIGVLLTYIISYTQHDFTHFYPAITVLIVSDIVASFVGKMALSSERCFLYSIDSKCFDIFHKTLSGSMSFLICTIIILLCFGFIGTSMVLAAIIITLIEFISTKGTDNVTIPIITYILLCVK